MGNEQEAPLPALYNHCVAVYAAMEKKAYPVSVEGLRMLVYEGKFTQLVGGVGLSVPYYTSVRQALMSMGCIRQLRRGGGGALSQWELVRQPTHELWATVEQPKGNARRTTGEVEQAIASVQQVQRDLAQRVSALENQVKELTK